MEISSNKYVPNQSTRYFAKICKVVFLVGLPNFWVDDVNFSKSFTRFYGYFSKCTNWLLDLLVLFELGSLFTQHNLTEKQSSDRLMFVFSQPVLGTYRIIMTLYERRVRMVLFKLSAGMKDKYNDEAVEKNMIKKTKFYLAAFLGLCSTSIIFLGVDALMLSIKTDVVFSTLITAWPDTRDTSAAARAVRVTCYVAWWLFMSRVAGAFAIVLSMIVALEHQYKNLHSYFNNLNDIFESKDLNHLEKERKYVNGLNIGIKLHSETLWCQKEVQGICVMIIVGQIFLNISVLVVLLMHMLTSDRSVETVFATVCTALATLMSTGCFMWTAGDVTVQASRLPTAIFSSGWQHCGISTKVARKLVVIAMAQAQKPVVMESNGLIQFSYTTYLAIVKTTYSVFSVIY